ncbi:MAG: hypothetical protein AAB561_01120 [Patescibacteria group bacterium]
MNKNELKKLTNELISERDLIINQLKDGAGKENPAIPGDFEPATPKGEAGADYDETINEAVEMDINVALEATLEKRLEEINQKLKEIESELGNNP